LFCGTKYQESTYPVQGLKSARTMSRLGARSWTRLNELMQIPLNPYGKPRHGTKMKIEVTEAGVDFHVKISRRKNNNDPWEVSCEYYTSSYSYYGDPDRRMYFNGIEKVSLQTHWHSGVRFISASGLE